MEDTGVSWDYTGCPPSDLAGESTAMLFVGFALTVFLHREGEGGVALLGRPSVVWLVSAPSPFTSWAPPTPLGVALAQGGLRLRALFPHCVV